MASREKPPARTPPRPPAGGPVKFGPFWLDSRLAVGGTAEVYLARPIDPQGTPRRLVVKRLLPQFLVDPEGRTMFQREAALHAAVHHENVVKVYAFGTHADEPWIAMEYVEGCDLFHLLRRLSSTARRAGPALACHIAREMLRALESVHAARDAQGQPLGIIHRDVTPSNIYLSSQGRVTLGDFGIARANTPLTKRTAAGAMLKGKFAYLAPEQVAGDPFDHRADLFATAAVLAEILLGHPLFAGSGQLAVLLAIRDCRIDPLHEAKDRLPPGLFEVLEAALARSPAARTPTATALLEALAPFDPSPQSSRAELAALVRWVQSAPSVDQMQAVRDSAAKLRAQAAAISNRPPKLAPEATASDEPPEVEAPPTGDDGERPTSEYSSVPSFVVTWIGARLGPWSYARLVEAVATGQVNRGDMVDYMGRGLKPLEAIEELARFLPAVTTATTARSAIIGSPDFSERVSPSALLAVLLRVIESQATGVLFADGPPADASAEGSAAGLRDSLGEGGHKELYFVTGRLHHVASNNASELLGEYLVRRRVISREELDFALAVLPRYNGRMGDTLISLGLVGSLEIFRAIRDQGRDRLVDVFRWPAGKLSFYSGQLAPHVDFPLDLDLPPLLLAGVEATPSTSPPLSRWRDRLGRVAEPVPGASSTLRQAMWPATARRLLDVVTTPMPLREALARVAQDGRATANETLTAFEVLVAAKLLRIG